ncbi:MAG TPA: DUF4296 domain-containing protein [Flavitalea sp.]|nr:DUF4296 domain-containing protein [Flavitalea sp.]
MKWILLCFLCFTFTACSKNDNIPPDIIGKEKMEKVLWDMIQADRFAGQYLLKDSLKKDVKQETFILYEKVFQLHHITKDQFVKSYKFYLSRPDITKVIFDSLALHANRRKEDVYKILK